MTTRSTALAIVLVLALSSVSLHAECLEYEPTTVSLKGELVRRTFAGPPNYESIKSGDRPETYWLLQLDTSICVAAKAKPDGLQAAESDIRELQLNVAPGVYESHQGLVGKRVVAIGSLVHAVSGHHHTAVLLSANSIEAAP